MTHIALPGRLSDRELQAEFSGTGKIQRIFADGKPDGLVDLSHISASGNAKADLRNVVANQFG